MLRAAEVPGGWLAPTVLAGAVVSASVKLGSVGAGYAARDLPNGALHTALHDINNVSYIVSMAPLALLTAATSVVVLRTRVLPRVFGWSGAVVAAALVANATAIGADFGPAFLLFLAWTLALSLTLTVRGQALAPASMPAAVPVG